VIIAVDGPAASGKGTIAKALASHFKLPHLDTGLLYRAVGMATIRKGGDPANPEDAATVSAFPDSLLNDPELRCEAAGQAASKASVHPAVRAALLKRQQDFANQPGGAVLDGRDIGTIIAPHADAKLFVIASPEARAKRRVLEEGDGADYAAILAEIRARDERDSGRSAAPLLQADDADLLDTSDLTVAQAIAQAIALVALRLRRD
jgi:CMP/dCMP kinase